MSDPVLARKASGRSASPYKTDVYVDAVEAAKSTGELSVKECLRLAKELKDVSQLPASCRAYLDKQANINKAYAGMGGSQAARATQSQNSTITRGMTHAQLQRRWTSRRDPLAKKK